MKHVTRFLIFLPILLAACASTQPPAPDPVQEQITLLQKQVLEVQKANNDTKAKLDEATTTINALNAKIKELEEKQTASPPVAQVVPEKKPAAPIKSEKKKPSKKQVKKKKKKVRRQGE